MAVEAVGELRDGDPVIETNLMLRGGSSGPEVGAAASSERTNVLSEPPPFGDAVDGSSILLGPNNPSEDCQKAPRRRSAPGAFDPKPVCARGLLPSLLPRTRVGARVARARSRSRGKLDTHSAALAAQAMQGRLEGRRRRTGFFTLLCFAAGVSGQPTLPPSSTPPPPDCSAYYASTGCGWTDAWACPPGVGTVGTAGNDGSLGYYCCCVAERPPPAPPSYPGFVIVSATVTDPTNMAQLDKYLVFQTDAPNSQDYGIGWSGTFEPGKCGNGAFPPADGVYYTQHNCRWSAFYFDERPENEVSAGSYGFRLTATSAADNWSGNGHNFYAQLNRADDAFTMISGHDTLINFTVTVGNPSNAFAGAALSVSVAHRPMLGVTPTPSSPPSYVVVTESLSWTSAAAYCSARGGSLAMMTSAGAHSLSPSSLRARRFRTRARAQTPCVTADASCAGRICCVQLRKSYLSQLWLLPASPMTRGWAATIVRQKARGCGTRLG